jgi:hypothetical protein
MHYGHFGVTGILILALVMTSGCAGLLMGDLKTEISDTSSLTIPLPISSVLSVLVSRNSTPLTFAWPPSGDKEDSAVGTQLISTSVLQMKPAKTDPSATGFSPISGGAVTSLSASGTAVIIKGGIPSCNPVAGANVVVSRVGISNKTHIADCVTEENGDLSFELPASTDKSPISQYILNFEITAPGYTLPAESPIIVTDMVNASDGPRYTFNVCLQQPSEPNAMAFTRGGIAVIERITS